MQEKGITYLKADVRSLDMCLNQREIETSIRTDLPVIFIVLYDNTYEPVKPDPFSSLYIQKETSKAEKPPLNGPWIRRNVPSFMWTWTRPNTNPSGLCDA